MRSSYWKTSREWKMFVGKSALFSIGSSYYKKWNGKVSCRACHPPLDQHILVKSLEKLPSILPCLAKMRIEAWFSCLFFDIVPHSANLHPFPVPNTSLYLHKSSNNFCFSRCTQIFCLLQCKWFFSLGNCLLSVLKIPWLIYCAMLLVQ